MSSLEEIASVGWGDDPPSPRELRLSISKPGRSPVRFKLSSASSWADFLHGVRERLQFSSRAVLRVTDSDGTLVRDVRDLDDGDALVVTDERKTSPASVAAAAAAPPAVAIPATPERVREASAPCLSFPSEVFST